MTLATLGLLAGALTTGAWLPQLLRTWRRGSAEDISWPYLLVFGSGVVGWLVYGVLQRDVAICAANGLTLALLSGLVALKAGVLMRVRA
ncbi:MtN3 and saliva related transmembrane protein [Motilibacter rhizosphaerae]|uniref:MtN3 and saliva related transmembrane protein n=1 Tax=Motilibacter rhizosphaerae TaxID=598652 RepID=A0A4Q7NQZ3_9ACTN|nr:SemiSWEET transporter [Motilibacter rhizosphaerae]RZS87030.1 MtN3 and saliva related transmembrane protein [Motilibacter rhizosphaerae]